MEKKIIHVVGNRPQFIKLAPLCKVLKDKMNCEQIIVHTGQHYDENMSKIFFEQLGIIEPKYNLQIGSGSHAEMTAKAMVGIEKVLIEEKPDVVILYGDTDSTLAGAIATSKLNIPIVHIEAGERTFKKDNPEEKNRIVTDHLSEILCCSSKSAVENLRSEGINQKVYFTGDIMYDIFLNQKIEEDKMLERYGIEEKKYILMTWHRQENTITKERMEKIIEFLESLTDPIIYPVHPRTRAMLEKNGLIERLTSNKKVILIDPIGYFEMMNLMKKSKAIITDSGGVSKESYFAGVKCYFIMNIDIWPELMKINWITQVNFDNKSNRNRIVEEINGGSFELPNRQEDLFGTGKTAEEIASILIENNLAKAKA